MLTDEAKILHQAEAWGGWGAASASPPWSRHLAPRLGRSALHLVIDEAGVFHDLVSGGCVEGEVVTAALDVIEDGAPRLLNFGVADEVAWRAGLPCGGCVSVYVQKLDATFVRISRRTEQRIYPAPRLRARHAA